MRNRIAIALIMPILAGAYCASGEDVFVNSVSALVSAAQGNHPDRRIIVAPGNYGHVWIGNANGSAGHLLQIVAQDPANPPVFLNGGSEGFQIADSSYLLLDGLVVRGATSEGIHINFTNTSTYSNHIILRNVVSDNVPTSGNTDDFKFDGTNNFLMYNCTASGCGDSGFDFVGCRETLIMRSTMTNNGGGGVHPKGGSYNFGFYKNTFNNAGERNLQFGGSSGSAYYHQGNYNNPGYEAYDQVAMGNVLIGGSAGMAYTSSWHCDFSYNTISNPSNYVMRILKEGGINNTSANGFTRNIVQASCTTQNIGGSTDPASFTYANNFWSQTPSITGTETGRVVGNPQLNAEYRPGNAAAKDYGAHAPGMEDAWAAYTSRFAWAWSYAANYDPDAVAGGTYKLYKHGSLGGSVALNGGGSYAGNNPNAGLNANYHQNTITAYAWDVNGDNVFTDASGATPVVSYAQLVGWGRGAAATYQVEMGINAHTDYGDMKDWDVASLVVAEAHDGDASFDGHVNVDDLGLLASNYDGSGKNWAQADFTGEGTVNVDDLGVLASNYDWVDAGGSEVPEPASLVLLLAGLAALRRRK